MERAKNKTAPDQIRGGFERSCCGKRVPRRQTNA
jgi:hypothetical protein